MIPDSFLCMECPHYLKKSFDLPAGPKGEHEGAAGGSVQAAAGVHQPVGPQVCCCVCVVSLWWCTGCACGDSMLVAMGMVLTAMAGDPCLLQPWRGTQESSRQCSETGGHFVPLGSRCVLHHSSCCMSLGTACIWDHLLHVLLWQLQRNFMSLWTKPRPC